jgi:hypothetical protein
LLFAIPAAIAALRLVNGAVPGVPVRIDAAGVGLASAGFFCLVYGTPTPRPGPVGRANHRRPDGKRRVAGLFRGR